MFTGIIERVGRLTGLEARGVGARVTIAHEPWPEALVAGESVAVQGVCLTVTACRATEFTCDVLEETLKRTSLGGKVAGSPLNLERALRADGRLGGHFVTGHVDGTGQIARLEARGPDLVLEVRCAADLLAGMVRKGSVAIDGVSLTLTEVAAAHFHVQLIPFTREHTSLRDVRAGDRVNLETDMLGKYVARFLSAGGAASATGVTWDDLQRAGFA